MHIKRFKEQVPVTVGLGAGWKVRQELMLPSRAELLLWETSIFAGKALQLIGCGPPTPSRIITSYSQVTVDVSHTYKIPAHLE